MQHVVCAAMLGIAVGAASPVLAQQFTFATGDRLLQGYNTARAADDDGQSGGGSVDPAADVSVARYQSNLAGHVTPPRAATPNAMDNPYARLTGLEPAAGPGGSNAAGGNAGGTRVALGKPFSGNSLDASPLKSTFGGQQGAAMEEYQGVTINDGSFVTPGTSGGGGNSCPSPCLAGKRLDGGRTDLYTFKFEAGKFQSVDTLLTPGAPPAAPVATFITASRPLAIPALGETRLNNIGAVAPGTAASKVTPTLTPGTSLTTNVAGTPTQPFNARQGNAVRAPDAIRGPAKSN